MEASHTDEKLSATCRGVVDVPVVAASGFEGDVVDGNLFRGDRSKIALSDEILGIGGIRLADGEDHLALELCFGVSQSVGLIGPHPIFLISCFPVSGCKVTRFSSVDCYPD